MGWAVTTNSGRMVNVRLVSANDKQGLLAFFASLSAEAVQWGLPPYNEEVVDRWMGNLQNMIALVAIHGQGIVGYSMITKSTHARRKGVGDLAIYLHQDFQNDGLGAAMIRYMIDLAQKEGLHRIGVHVIADNKIAVHLYEKFGFAKEGLLKDSYFGEDKKYHDEIVLGLLLPVVR